MITAGGIYGIRHFGEEQILYIGKTKNNFYIRWGQHLTSILNPKLPQLPWYDVERDNLNNLDFIILHDCRAYPVEDDNALAELEKRYIKEYEPIYNIRGNKEKRIQERQKRILKEFFKDKEGIVFNRYLKEEATKKLKEMGMVNKRYEKDFAFDYVMRACKEHKICNFIRARVRKKHLFQNPHLSLGESCVIIKLFPQEEERS